ncbi:B12-binding domain-containing radical SAM protein [uncultured Ruminococcus sp.]|uniref:B12-binding domain-containing radical SAM protein n=1 Tax=uncultured Ruminococcus sp. TaxID=165186 RepID=UPI00260E6B47|nr:cobalamin-dependent protein [uncultured Ruminococcus sp.]
MERYMFVRVHYDKRVASLEPLGLEYLMACVKAEKRFCMIHDEGIESPFGRFKRLLKKVDDNRITVVGFSVMSNTAWYVLKLIKKLRKARPKVKIMVGGPEVIVNHEDFLLKEIDYVSYDNGLDSFRKAVRNDLAVSALKDCTGHAFRVKGRWVCNPKGEPIDSYGILPDRSHFYNNRKKFRVLAKGCFSVMKTSFSCPQHCKFCISRQFNSCQYRERPDDEVIGEIMSLDNDKVFIIDDDFLVNRERVIRICRRLLELNCRKTFMIFARADSIVRCRDIMPLIYKAGFRDMLVGLEAVEDTTLEKYNKNSSVYLNKEAIKILRKHRMICVGLFVINYDFTHRDFMRINEFIRREKLIWVLFSILIPFKGTDVYEENKDRLYKYKYRRTGGTSVLMRPSALPMLLFKLEFHFLYYVNYPRIYWAGITGLFNHKYKKK